MKQTRLLAIGRCLRVASTHFRSAKALGVLAPSLMLLGCASVPPLSEEHLSSAQVSLVQQTCNDIMGLRTGGAQFDACRDSLADSLGRLAAEQQLEHAHDTCERAGNAAHTTALARCVVVTDAQARTVPTALTRSDTVIDPPTDNNAANVPRISFWKMSRPVRHERERLACAQLGMDPVTREFDQCVGEMTQAFWDLENPL